MGLTRVLAEYLVQSRMQEIPVPVRHEATRSLLNWIGCALGGCHHEAVTYAHGALSAVSGPGHAVLIGNGGKTDALSACLLNGIAGHVLDFDDAQPRNTNINPSCTVAPAALAVGEYAHASGSEVLHAFLLGLEVECRIANTVYAQGSTRFFANSTTGIFGAAAAAGKLLQLDAQQMTWALGLAATQAAGLRIVFGTMSKAFIVGRMARAGAEAAVLAQQGFTSSEQGLEAPKGFAALFGPGMDTTPIIDGLGREFEVSHNTYKPFACGIVLHAAIDACIRARNTHGINPGDIASVTLRVNPAVIEVTGNPAPASGLEGKFSVSHCAAVALIDGAAGEPQYSDERVLAADVQALRTRIRPLPNPALARHQATAEIRMADGRLLETRVEHALGSRGNPLRDEDLDAKLAGLAAGILPPKNIPQVLQQCWNIEALPDIRELTRLIVPA